MGLLLPLSMATSASAPGAAASAPAADRLTLAELLDNPPLDQLQHTSWGAREGLLGPVYSLAQTTDGYLWLGTDRGLLRFDGIRFEPFETLAGEQLAGQAILNLYATPDNGLWIGYLRGGAALVRNGHIVSQEMPREGGFQGSTRVFAREKDGTVWVAATRGLFKRVGDHWVRQGPEQGLPSPDSGALSMYVAVDGDGHVWVNTSTGLYVKAATKTRFVPVTLPGRNLGFLAVDPQGRMWTSVEVQYRIGGGNMRLYRLPRPDTPSDQIGTNYPIHPSTYMPIFDRQGNLWSGALDGLTRERFPREAPAADQGLSASATSTPPSPLVPLAPATTASGPTYGEFKTFRFAQPSVQRLTPGQRLSGDEVLRILQDREGSIWVATNGGLDRLRPAKVSRFQFPLGMSTNAMAVAPNGDAWFTSRNGIYRLPAQGSGADLVSYPLPSPSVSRVFVDRAGTVWLGDRNGLGRLEANGQLIDEREPGKFPDWRGTLRDIAEDRAGTLWISTQFMGLMRRFPDGHWERLSGKNGFPSASNASTIAVDAKGRVWVGHADGLLMRIDEGDRITRFTDKDGLHVGGVLALTVHDDHLWIGGDRGVQRFDDGVGLRTVRGVEPKALNGVSGIVETPQGELWLNGAAGITRIEAPELRRALADPAHRVALTQLDTLDGLPGRAETSWPLRTAMQTADGRLWFTVTNGVITVDPGRLTRAAAAPAIDIQRVMVNGERVPPQAGGLIRTAAGTRDLQVDYTSLSLATPERARFKYRLRGLETAWHDAGTRRQAFYTNLGPGTYGFEVQVSEEEGVWSASPAHLPIEIPPTFVQSGVFRALCVLGGLALLAFLARMRLRQLEARSLERHRARLEERTRIAQDLHDTLLQGFQGMLLRLQRVAWGIPKESPARAEMERVLDQAEEVVIDGRNRVTDLRLPPPDAGTLEQVLGALGRDLSGYHDAAFDLVVAGAPRPLEACVHAELALAGREALFNAFQHAKARRIVLTLGYGDEALRLAVADDGVGVPETTLAQGRSPGHWGLSGMRDRVAGIGGSFTLRSAPDTGTELVMRVPAAQAYRQAPRPRTFFTSGIRPARSS